MKIRDNISSIIIKTIALFSISTLLTGIPIIGSLINKIMIIILCLELVYYCTCIKYKIFDVICIFFMVVLTIISLFYTSAFKYNNLNMVFYLPIWVVLLIIFTRNKNVFITSIYDNVQFLKIITNIWFLLVIFSFLFPTSYVSREHVFASFTGNTFRFSPAVLLITVIIFIIKKISNEKKYNFYLIITAFLMITGGSRTYFGVYLLFILSYFIISIRKKMNVLVLFLLIGCTLLIALPYTGIGRKINSTTYTEYSYYDPVATFTSGRSIFWKYDMQAFFDLPISQRFVGNGYNFPYEINEKYMNNPVWAHNDFINILMNYGYIGLFIYLYSFTIFYKKYVEKIKINKKCKFLYFIAIFLNSFFNMSYTYLCAFFSYILFAIFLNIDKEMVIKYGEQYE